MKSLWDSRNIKSFKDDELAMRVYTSRLLGSSQDLVLHGGGNTSVKIDGYLYVKGSGWDLDTIEKEGFPAVNLEVLKKMVQNDSLSDTQMVAQQREAMKDKNFPNPSVEAILHAIIPFKYVDHTHTDAVVTITNTPKGKEYIENIYGKNMLIIDYVMPGFILAKEIYEKTKDIDWSTLDGIILLNHGVFTFNDDPRKSYEKMIEIVTKAEEFLKENASVDTNHQNDVFDIAIYELVNYSEKISSLRGKTVKASLLNEKEAYYFASMSNVNEIVNSGPLTPEHVIRTKAFPMIVESEFDNDLKLFIQKYEEYFKKFAKDETMLDLAPRYVVFKNRGVVVFGVDEKEITILKDIVSHTIKAMIKAQKLGGWKSLNKKDIFEMEYWELEQAKLKKSKE